MKHPVAFAAFLALAMLGTCWGLWYHGVDHFLGIDTQQSQNYDFVSGVGPMITTVLGYSGMIITLVAHVNCHAPGCWRIGKYPLAGGQFKVCRRHHADERVRTGKLTLGHMHDLHWLHHGKPAPMPAPAPAAAPDAPA